MSDISIKITPNDYELIDNDKVALSQTEIVNALVRRPTHATKGLGETFSLITVDDIVIDKGGRTIIHNKEFREAFQSVLEGPSPAQSNTACLNIICGTF